MDMARQRVCEALFLANAIGLLGMVVLVARPAAVLSLVMPAGSAALPYAIKYLRLRSLSPKSPILPTHSLEMRTFGLLMSRCTTGGARP